MKCQFPACRQDASTTWALVPLCEAHHVAIKEETDAFYSGKSGKSETEQRPKYNQISGKIPWSKANMRVGDWK